MLAFPIASVTMGKISRTVPCLSLYARSRKLFAASHCNVRFTQVATISFPFTTVFSVRQFGYGGTALSIIAAIPIRARRISKQSMKVPLSRRWKSEASAPRSVIRIDRSAQWTDWSGRIRHDWQSWMLGLLLKKSSGTWITGRDQRTGSCTAFQICSKHPECTQSRQLHRSQQSKRPTQNFAIFAARWSRMTIWLSSLRNVSRHLLITASTRTFISNGQSYRRGKGALSSRSIVLRLQYARQLKNVWRVSELTVRWSAWKSRKRHWNIATRRRSLMSLRYSSWRKRFIRWSW